MTNVQSYCCISILPNSYYIISFFVPFHHTLSFLLYIPYLFTNYWSLPSFLLLHFTAPPLLRSHVIPFLSINFPDLPPSFSASYHRVSILFLPQWVLQWSCWSVRPSAGSTMTWTRSTSPATCSKSAARRRCCRSEYTPREKSWYHKLLEKKYVPPEY